jgi:hypothetical protein
MFAIASDSVSVFMTTSCHWHSQTVLWSGWRILPFTYTRALRFLNFQSGRRRSALGN